MEDARRAALPVIVAGGGIGGLATAIGLSGVGYRVTVLEKAQELGEIGVRDAKGNFADAFRRYQDRRITRTARIVLASRELARSYHAAGVERLLRNDRFATKTPQDFYRSLDWLYGYGRD